MTTTGTITSDVTASDTVINVSQTVIDNVNIGYKIQLDDSTNTDDLGIVTAIDTDNKTITVDTAATQGFSAATPTYVKQTVCMVSDYEIGPAWEWVIGESKIGGSHLPANTTVEVKYTNNSAITAKKLVAKIEYLY